MSILTSFGEILEAYLYFKRKCAVGERTPERPSNAVWYRCIFFFVTKYATFGIKKADRPLAYDVTAESRALVEIGV